jgi:Ca2+-binding RTX toxin-like protein
VPTRVRGETSCPSRSIPICSTIYGSDYIYGIAASNSLHGTAGRDYIDGKEGNATLTATTTPTLVGGIGNDNLNAATAGTGSRVGRQRLSLWHLR